MTNDFTEQRILVLGKRGGVLQWYEHMLAAQSPLSPIKIKGFALNHNNTFERIKNKFLGTINKSLKEIVIAQTLEQKLLDFMPNTIIITDLFYLSDPSIKTLERYKKNNKIAHWIGDSFDERLLHTKQLIDDFYFTDSLLLKNAKDMGISNSHFLPLAFNPETFKKPKREKRKNDLLFIGAWSENREKIIRGISTPITVIGKGWGRIHDSQHHVTNRNIANKEVAKLYQQHACVLNIINSNNISHGLNMRCFEAPACGALLITDNVKDLPKSYKPDELVTYSSPQELSTLYSKLCSNPKTIEQISKNGNQRAKSEHTYMHRIKEIIKIKN